MSTFYWVGGTGTWDNAATAHWSAASGGAAGAGPPKVTDDVIFDANSMPTLTTVTIATTAVCKTLTANLPALVNIVFNLSGNWTIPGNVVFNGGSAITHPVIQSASGGVQRTWTINGSATFSNVDFMDIAAAGTAAPFTGAAIGDCLGNSNITFPARRILYWVATAGGNWSATTSWALASGGASGAAVPLPHDDVIFDANSITSAGRTITFNIARAGRNVDLSHVTNQPTIAFNINWNMYGDLIWGNVIIGGTSTQSCRGRGAAQRFDPAGLTFTQAWLFAAYGGTYVLQRDYVTTVANTVTTALQVNGGGFDANGKNVTANSVVFQAGTNVKMGSGTWTITGASTAQVAQVLAISPSSTLDSGTSMIVIADTSANAKALQFGGKALYNLTIPGGGGPLTTNNNPQTFNNVTISGPKTITWPSSQTQTMVNLLARGTPGNLITMNSSTPGTRWNINVTSGLVTCDYLALQDSAAIGAATEYAGSHSVDNGNNTGWIFADYGPPAHMLIRERPPLRLHATISTPSGSFYRWGPDERRAERACSGITFATVMPGGFDQASLTLPRDPSFDYSDLEELSTVTIRGAGGRSAWQGRMETTPRTSGDQMAISPGLVGWQSHLDDDNSARMIYYDCDFSNWQGASNQRKINLLNGNVDEEDGDTGPDWTTGHPALITSINGPWSRQHCSELWYDAHGIPLRIVYYNWWLGATMNGGDANWSWLCALTTDDVGTALDSSGNLRGVGTGVGFLSATATNRKFVLLQALYAAAAGAAGTNYPIFWNVAVVGAHSAPIITGSWSGVRCSDVEADAVARWAPKLKFTTGVNGSLQPSTFIIPQLVFTDPTTASAIIKGANQYELRDWAVWEGPTYYSNALGARGRKWVSRVRDAKLEETGPTASRLFNGVVVTYQDVTGISRMVGPPGSGADNEDASLTDYDTLNPANELAIRKWAPLAMIGTSTPAGAIQTGAQFLQYQKQLDTSGQATLTGHVQDDSGVFEPAFMVRAGDQIMFPDAGDFSYRRIVSSSYDDSSKTNQIQLDAPPDGMQALLERLSVVLTPIGFS